MNSIKFNIMYKTSWLSKPEVAAIGYILPNKKIRVTYVPIVFGIPDDIYNNYNSFVDTLPNECYVVFDNVEQ